MKNGITDCAVWAMRDWGDIDFGDLRLNHRAVHIGADFFRNPFASPPKMLKSNKKIKAFYRFMDSDKVSHDKLTSSHVAQSRQRIADHKIILAIEDFTTLAFDREYDIEGLYDVGNIQGVVVHNTISVMPLKDHGIIDGLLNQIIVHRADKSARTHANSESQAWMQSISAVGKPAKTTVVDVMDRGADALEIMHFSRAHGHEFLIRAKQNRYIQDEKYGYLFDYGRALPSMGEMKLDVNKSDSQKKRTATLRIAFSLVTLDTPKNNPRIPPLVCNIVHVREINPPENQDPVECFLLTSLSVSNIDDAMQVIKFYSYRWIIEEYHKCLKTGFRLEKTQLHTLQRIENLLGFISVSAVKLLQMRDISRYNPLADALSYVTAEDVNIVKAYYEVKDKHMTVDRFLRYIAQMGGFMNRKSDGNPGWQSIWEGWKFFMGLKEGVHLNLKRCG
jgi:hypothetical protein